MELLSPDHLGDKAAASIILQVQNRWSDSERMLLIRKLALIDLVLVRSDCL
jgi:hypothetical protein